MTLITYVLYGIGIAFAGWKFGYFNSLIMVLLLILFELIKIRNILEEE